jgi:excinuclease ABC subunit B
MFATSFQLYMDFKLVSDYQPAGDQPKAIETLVNNLKRGENSQVLLGVTGSGKTFTIANVIAKLKKPTLVIAHNKTLAAQLCSELREFFPDNAVEYFISYYDYYQPEAYIPARDAYIEKEAQINENIERLRHSATRSLLIRKDVIIVASVSCIYGLGLPEDYIRGVIPLKVGQSIPRHQLLEKLERVQYERNDIELKRGRYRVVGETIDIYESWDEAVIRLLFFGDEIEKMWRIHPISGEILEEKESADIFPATHYVINSSLDHCLAEIKAEMEGQVKEFLKDEKLLEAKRIEQRTKYDMEMMAEMGYCKGIENYSRIISGREPGACPGVLMDFFPEDFLTIIDESHVTVPQIRGMQEGDKSRKSVLVQYGFRLPSAMDNRPLKFDEFNQKLNQCIYVSATPSAYELEKAGGSIVEQIIRPTGLVDPEVDVRPTLNQIDNLISEIQIRVQREERVLITAVTKQLSEDITTYLDEKGIKVRYLHSDIHSLDRLDILHDLRLGKFDVLVGVNLLREGLDLPEVSLVAIMDADKEGFLRNEKSLIQTIGRAARNINGKVILYADRMTESMKKAINETNRRRTIQLDYNKAHNITPKSVVKKIKDIRSGERDTLQTMIDDVDTISPEKLPSVISKLEKDMKEAAKNLEFELAAILRDQIEKLKQLSVD